MRIFVLCNCYLKDIVGQNQFKYTAILFKNWQIILPNPFPILEPRPKVLISRYNIFIVFPRIVSSLEYFSNSNSFCSLSRKVFKFSWHKGTIIATNIWNFQHLKDSKKNRFRGSYLRKYGNYIIKNSLKLPV